MDNKDLKHKMIVVSHSIERPSFRITPTEVKVSPMTSFEQHIRMCSDIMSTDCQSVYHNHDEVFVYFMDSLCNSDTQCD